MPRDLDIANNAGVNKRGELDLYQQAARHARSALTEATKEAAAVAVRALKK